MKHKKLTKLFAILAIGFSAVMLSSCTASFCSNQDKSRMLYAYDFGVTSYVDSDTSPLGYEVIINDVFDTENTYNAYLTKLLKSANESKYTLPTIEYFAAMDEKLLEYAINNGAIPEGASAEEIEAGLLKVGYWKFYGSDEELFTTWTTWTNELKIELGLEYCPNTDFTTYYKSQLNSAISNNRACIATVEGFYGNYGQNSDTQVLISQKDWGYAWSKGFLEGLLIFPISWLIDTISINFGAGAIGFNSAWPQVFAILLVTLIIRGIMLLASFKTTLGQQKMQALQPELAKIQAKYPNANTNQYQKQRLAQEQMALYKKNKINPMGQIIVMVFQFPIFICVWGAMQGSAILTTGSVLGLDLSASIGSTLANFTNWPANGWWTALVLFILMAGAQFVSMKLPQWFQKHAQKNVKKLTKNPAMDKQQKQMKWFSNIMLVMIVIMGITLPAAMGVYWFAGALISCLQTLITQLVLNRKRKDKVIKR